MNTEDEDFGTNWVNHGRKTSPRTGIMVYKQSFT